MDSFQLALGCKLVLIGESGVGKTSICERICNDSIPEKHIPTVFHSYKTEFIYNETPVKLELCDTSGLEDYDVMRHFCFPGAHCFILVFSYGSIESINLIWSKWCKEIFSKGDNGTPFIIIGNQLDLKKEIITKKHISKMLKSVGGSYGFYETSCVNEQLDHSGLPEVFGGICDVITSKNRNLTEFLKDWGKRRKNYLRNMKKISKKQSKSKEKKKKRFIQQRTLRMKDLERIKKRRKKEEERRKKNERKKEKKKTKMSNLNLSMSPPLLTGDSLEDKNDSNSKGQYGGFFLMRKVRSLDSQHRKDLTNLKKNSNNSSSSSSFVNSIVKSNSFSKNPNIEKKIIIRSSVHDDLENEILLDERQMMDELSDTEIPFSLYSVDDIKSLSLNTNEQKNSSKKIELVMNKDEEGIEKDTKNKVKMMKIKKFDIFSEFGQSKAEISEKEVERKNKNLLFFDSEKKLIVEHSKYFQNKVSEEYECMLDISNYNVSEISDDLSDSNINNINNSSFSSSNNNNMNNCDLMKLSDEVRKLSISYFRSLQDLRKRHSLRKKYYDLFCKKRNLENYRIQVLKVILGIDSDSNFDSSTYENFFDQKLYFQDVFIASKETCRKIIRSPFFGLLFLWDSKILDKFSSLRDELFNEIKKLENDIKSNFYFDFFESFDEGEREGSKVKEKEVGFIIESESQESTKKKIIKKNRSKEEEEDLEMKMMDEKFKELIGKCYLILELDDIQTLDTLKLKIKERMEKFIIRDLELEGKSSESELTVYTVIEKINKVLEDSEEFKSISEIKVFLKRQIQLLVFKTNIGRILTKKLIEYLEFFEKTEKSVKEFILELNGFSFC